MVMCYFYLLEIVVFEFFPQNFYWPNIHLQGWPNWKPTWMGTESSTTGMDGCCLKWFVMCRLLCLLTSLEMFKTFRVHWKPQWQEFMQIHVINCQEMQEATFDCLFAGKCPTTVVCIFDPICITVVCIQVFNVYRCISLAKGACMCKHIP